MSRRFPPPWLVEQIPGGFKVLDANGQSLAYVYTRDGYRIWLFLNKLLCLTDHHNCRGFIVGVTYQVENIIEVDVDLIPITVRAY
jgi:hypothetical protein